MDRVPNMPGHSHGRAQHLPTVSDGITQPNNESFISHIEHGTDERSGTMFGAEVPGIAHEYRDPQVY